MQQSYSKKGARVNRFLKSIPSLINCFSRKITGPTVCLFILALFISVLPSVSAAGQFGVTTTGSTDYPTATFGNTGTGSSSGSLANCLIATKYTLTVDATITKISAYSSSSGNWKLGIYTDNAGTPGTLKAANNNANPVTPGYNTFDIGPVFLEAGTYWIATLDDTSSTRRYQAGSTKQAAYRLNFGFANNMPNTFGTPTGTQNNDYVAYCTYVQIEGYAKATKVTLSEDDAVLSSISFYSHSTGNYRVAIYSDNSGPSALLWESSDTSATEGWNTIPISSGSPTALTLDSGTYWLVWQWNSANLGPSYAEVSNAGQYLTLGYGAFPATWTGGAVSSEQWSIYVSYEGSIPSVLPEYPLGAILAVVLCFGAFAVFIKRQKPSS